MTHKELVELAAKQLKKWRCLPICTELVSYTRSGEIPDAIGWTAAASIMFECKTSRADFLRDREKPFRMCNNMGMGDFRFYLTPPGIIKDERELPPGWGLYEAVNGRAWHKFGVRYDNAVPHPFVGSKINEIILMRSWIRRQQ